MKALGFFVVLAVLSGAALSYAADLSAVTSVVKGSKSYQSRVLSDVRPDDDSVLHPVGNPVSVEPASGDEAEIETEQYPEMNEGSEAIRSLQDSLSSPAN